MMRVSHSCRGQELVAQADQVSLPNGEGWYGIGGGWQAYGEQLRPRLGAQLKASDGELLCRAEEVALLGVDGFARGEAGGRRGRTASLST